MTSTVPLVFLVLLLLVLLVLLLVHLHVLVILVAVLIVVSNAAPLPTALLMVLIILIPLSAHGRESAKKAHGVAAAHGGPKHEKWSRAPQILMGSVVHNVDLHVCC
jgi:hypothetical protein